MDGIADQVIGAVEQGKIHAPGIQANGGDIMPGGFYALLQIMPDAEGIPKQGAARLDGDIGEAVDFFNL